MEKAQFSEELMRYISNMNRENSVVQFSVPGKGRFTLTLEEEQSIKTDIKANPKIEIMIRKSQEEYNKGLGVSSSGLLNSISPKDFI